GVGVLEVERKAFLGAVGPDKVRRQAAHAFVVAAGEVAGPGAFDLDDARAHVGQLARAEGGRDGVLQAYDRNAVEGTDGNAGAHAENLSCAWWASVPSCSAHRSATPGSPTRPARSEEHTSELQSRENLVCRLLLVK